MIQRPGGEEAKVNGKQRAQVASDCMGEWSQRGGKPRAQLRALETFAPAMEGCVVTTP